MASSMTFIINGRDELSRALNRAGASAARLQRQLQDTARRSSASMGRMTRDVSTRMRDLQTTTGAGTKAMEALKGATLSLAPAAIPAAAALAPIVAQTGAATVAVAAYGAALGPQVAAMGEASEAEKKYADAVEASGRQSEAAVTAQVEYQRKIAAMPPATRRAAAALSTLKDSYKEWSDSLAADTMAPFTKGLAVAGALLPRTTGLVKGASRELDRMVTLLAGAMQTPGFDRVNQRFTAFATGSLQRVTNGIVHLTRSLNSGGGTGGGFAKFMDYARANGPLVGDTLRNIGQALSRVVSAAADVGVGMLQAVNAISKLIAAVPAGAITALLQMAIAIKVVRLAALGLAAAKGALAAFGAQLLAMQAAATAAPGRLAAVTAAIGALSRGAKVALVGTGIGLLVLAIGKLSSMGREAPPNVDKLTSSMGKLAETGKVSGEAARAFGADLGGLAESLRTLSRPSNTQGFQQFATSLIGMDSTPVKKAKEELDGVDKSLAALVQGGNSDRARAAFDATAEAMRKKGMSAAELRRHLGDYKSALADQQFEERLAAQSMGLFGEQALAVQAKLDAQKRSTDGLRQSIIALNEVNRAALEGRAGMEAAIDAATAGSSKYSSALRIVRGELDQNSASSREAAALLTDLARKTEENVTSARNSGKSWDYAKGQYDRGRAALIRAADSMGLSRAEARRYADQILKTPNKTAYIRGNIADLKGKLADAKSKLRKVPDSRKASVRATIADLQSKIRQAKAALSGIRGRTVTVSIIQKYFTVGRPRGPMAGGYAFANGGLVRGFPGGGLIRGPGTGTSDSILARVSNREFVIRARSVAKYGTEFMEALNEGRLSMASASGGKGMRGGGGGDGRAGTSVKPVLRQQVVNINIAAFDPVSAGREVRRVLLELRRTYGGMNLGV